MPLVSRAEVRPPNRLGGEWVLQEVELRGLRHVEEWWRDTIAWKQGEASCGMSLWDVTRAAYPSKQVESREKADRQDGIAKGREWQEVRSRLQRRGDETRKHRVLTAYQKPQKAACDEGKQWREAVVMDEGFTCEGRLLIYELRKSLVTDYRKATKAAASADETAIRRQRRGGSAVDNLKTSSVGPRF
ncbi:MAG: hypothetical protein SGPRY_010126 [Prymnesium sp.]